MTYNEILTEVYDGLFNYDVEKIRNIICMLERSTQDILLTETQREYIINKSESFISYWYSKVLADTKVFMSLNNNLKIDSSNICKFCLYFRYMPNDRTKGYLFKHLMSFIRHNRNKYDEYSYKSLTKLIIKSALWQLK